MKNRIATALRKLTVAVIVVAAPASFMTTFAPATASAIVAPDNDTSNPASGGPQCGSGKNAVKTSVAIGCRGEACQTGNPDGCSALVDGIFAVIRFLSAGVGIVIIGSLIFAGIQYSAARDDPGAIGKAKGRIISNVIALGLFIFGYAILNFVIPAGFFQ